jgi:demethylmenaquinone methyltransferase/2-methoxy-6-polyprenyl-1,4-benzoquinol methylase
MTGKPSTALAPHQPLKEFYGDSAGRAEFVDGLFDRAAPDYDWINRVMSLGSGAAYRRRALGRAGVAAGMKLLDVGTGTGLVAQAGLDVGMGTGEVIGVDPSRGMLEENRKGRSIGLVQGRGESLPFRNETFDRVVMGYALRHVEDLGALLAEFHRVLRPGGKALLLEITRPSTRTGYAVMRFLMQRVLPALTRWGTRREESARLVEYYWATIAECVPPDAILSALSGAGFQGAKRFTCGSVLSEYLAAKA